MEEIRIKEEEEVMVVVDGGGYCLSSSPSTSSCSNSPKPMEGLHEMGPPPFLTKTFEMVENCETNSIVSWSNNRNSFIVWDSHIFSITLLPKYFKHSNFSSFIRQLNIYGFRKVVSDRWEFANEWFLGGQKHLLRNIKRRKQKNNQQGGIDGFLDNLTQLSAESEIDKLKKERSSLMVEVFNLKEKQKKSIEQMVSIQERLQGTERKQQLTMAFLAKAFKNPIFIQQLIQTSEKKNVLLGGTGKKRRLTPSKSVENFQEELIPAPMGTMDHGSEKPERVQKIDGNTRFDSEDDKLWDELLNEDFITGKKEVIEVEDDENEFEFDIQIDDFWVDGVPNLVEQMGYLGPKN